MSFLDPGLKTLHMSSTFSPSRELKDGRVYVPVSAVRTKTRDDEEKQWRNSVPLIDHWRQEQSAYLGRSDTCKEI